MSPFKSALEEGEWSPAHPGCTLPPPRKTRYPFYRSLGGPQGRSGWAENLVPTGIQSRTIQPVAQSLYQMSYPAHYLYTSTWFFMLYTVLKKLPNYNTSSFIQNICDQKSGFTSCDFELSNIFITCLPVYLVGLCPDVMMKAISFVLLNWVIYFRNTVTPWLMSDLANEFFG